MAIFLGVTNKKSVLELDVGAKSYWCVYSNYEAHIGDLIIMYKTVHGIAQIYRITSEPYSNGQISCTMRNMLTVETALFANIINPVRVSEMKAVSVLQEWGALRRNFQQTTFKMTDIEWNALKNLIVDKNPELSEMMVAIGSN